MNSFGRMLDSCEEIRTIPLTDAAVIRQNKPEAATLKSPQNKNSSLSSDRQFLRAKKDRQKHRAPQSSATKPVNVKPPRFSISPE